MDVKMKLRLEKYTVHWENSFPQNPDHPPALQLTYTDSNLTV